MEIKNELIISFPWGLPGLDYNEFKLSILKEDSPFYFLQSTARHEVGLLLMNPFLLFKEYEFNLSEEVTVQLGITDQKQVGVLCAINTSRGIEAATINLLAPIVININRLIAKQIVLNDKRYSLRTRLALSRAVHKGGA